MGCYTYMLDNHRKVFQLSRTDDAMCRSSLTRLFTFVGIIRGCSFTSHHEHQIKAFADISHLQSLNSKTLEHSLNSRLFVEIQRIGCDASHCVFSTCTHLPLSCQLTSAYYCRVLLLCPPVKVHEYVELERFISRTPFVDE